MLFGKRGRKRKQYQVKLMFKCFSSNHHRSSILVPAILDATIIYYTYSPSSPLFKTRNTSSFVSSLILVPITLNSNILTHLQALEISFQLTFPIALWYFASLITFFIFIYFSSSRINIVLSCFVFLFSFLSFSQMLIWK